MAGRGLAGGAFVEVEGLGPLLSALHRADQQDLKRELREGFRDIGKEVTKEAKARVGLIGLKDTGRLQNSIREKFTAGGKTGTNLVVRARSDRFRTPKRRKTKRRSREGARKDFAALYYPRLYEYGAGNIKRRAFLWPAVDDMSRWIDQRAGQIVDDVLRTSGLSRQYGRAGKVYYAPALKAPK